MVQDKSTGIIYSFSLGYRCDYSKNEPYLVLDAMAMSNIVKEHGILSGSGIGKNGAAGGYDVDSGGSISSIIHPLTLSLYDLRARSKASSWP